MQMQGFKSVLIRSDLKLAECTMKEPSSSKQVVDFKLKQQGNTVGVGEPYWPGIQAHIFLYFRTKISHTLAHTMKNKIFPLFLFPVSQEAFI